MRLVASLELTSALADMGRVYPWLDEAVAGADLPDDLLTRMHVALEEAVANVAMHGFEPGAVGRVTLALRTARDACVLEIEDNGMAFDPTAAAVSSGDENLAEVRIGGRGLTLIRACVTDISYERRGMRNHLSLRFALPPPPAGGRGAGG